MSRFGRRRLRAVRAADVRPGDTLWSSATERPLRVFARSAIPVDPDGNLYADPEEPGPGEPAAIAIVLAVLNPDGSTQRLGAFAPRARLQVLR